MAGAKGFTLMEMIVVLVILGVTLGIAFPSFTTSTEHARASNVQHNLLAIYSAQQNYNNNNGSYCTSTTNPNPCDTLADINTALSLSIQDDGTYNYSCPVNTNTCTATRNNGSSTPLITLTLNAATNLSGNGTANPVCSPAGNAWCP